MGNEYKDELTDYNGKSYYKGTSGIWLETNYKSREENKSLEEDIKDFAKKVAKQVRKPTSTIKIPFEKKIQYEVEKNVEISKGFSVFKSTKIKKVLEQQTGTNIDYKDVRIDGWVLKTYYENVDTVVNGKRMEQAIDKRFYVLKKDGKLSVFKLGYVIKNPKTNWESVRFYQELAEWSMDFDTGWLDLARSDIHCTIASFLSISAYALDFQPVKWEHSHKKGYYEILYFKGNSPLSNGLCGSKGESYLITKAGTGIMEALKKLEKGRVKK